MPFDVVQRAFGDRVDEGLHAAGVERLLLYQIANIELGTKTCRTV